MPQAPPGLHRPPGTSGVARPLATPRGTQRPSGSRRYHVNSKPQIMTGWAAGPPEGFVTGNTSLDEWPIWWALNKILGPPGAEWLYQGRIGIGMLGSSKPDFVVFQDPPLVIRVQSDRYHLTVNGFRQAYDREQRVTLERAGYHVIDVFPQHYMYDPTYSTAVLIVVREALSGRQRADPLTTFTSIARA
jgi:hypothetical protein